VFRERLEDGPQVAFEHRGVEGLFALEVVVEARNADAHRGGDVAQARARVAALGKKPFRRIEDSPGGELALA
jgi:hypothetical protein